ncbi:hypothetical protein [Subtercola endophyticus]|uniref:hypothetical protein n=1 Tax=Subtercola endophyticus TaxID=2895559 RepID=UPI001E2B8E33|nr:hypothetical protein [Subtercola endophyticus]UFS60209.1 hypothetical protein LQ955_05485 [Subtercola endophyticus]
MPHFTSLSSPSRRSSTSQGARRPSRKSVRRRDVSASPLVPGYDLVETLGPGPGWAPDSVLGSVLGSPPVSRSFSPPFSSPGSTRRSTRGSAPSVARYLAAPSGSPHPQADRVVVSVYSPEAAPAALERARLWQRLESAHCPEFLDEVDLAPGFAVVTPWLSCGSLQALLERRRLRVGEAVTILVPLAQLLARLHTLGATHGDVRASAVLFDERGTPVLVGWGGLVAGPEVVPDDVADVARDDVAGVARDVTRDDVADIVRDAGSRPAPGVMPPFDNDVRDFVLLSREVFGRCLLDSELVPGFVTAGFVTGTAELTTQFFHKAEQQLFRLAEARAIDPLVPYDWGAESSQALAQVDAAVRSDVERQLLARSPRARVRWVSGLVMRMAVAFPRSLVVASARVRSAGGVPLWPGSRSTVHLKTLGIAATVCAVAVTGALVATPSSTPPSSTSTSNSLSASAASAAAEQPRPAASDGSHPVGVRPSGTSPSGTPSPGTSPSGAPSPGTSPSGAPSPRTSPNGTPSPAALPADAPPASIAAADGPSTSIPSTSVPSTAAPSVPPGVSAPAATSAPTPPSTMGVGNPGTSSGAVADVSDSDVVAAISGDDPAAALAALLLRRDRCFHQAFAVCFDEVDQPQSPALATDQQEFGDAVRTGSNPSQITVATGSSASNDSVAGNDDGPGIQRVGDAAVARVWVVEPTAPPGNQLSNPPMQPAGAVTPRPPLAALSVPQLSLWAATHTTSSSGSAVLGASPTSSVSRADGGEGAGGAEGASTASDPSATLSTGNGAGIGNASDTTGQASSGGRNGVGVAQKQPASTLLVKGEAGWRIRAVFVPAG